MSSAHSQPTPSSTPADELRRTQVVAALERSQAEVRESRKLIDLHREQIKALRAERSKLTELNETNEKLRVELDKQIGHLELAIVDLKSALKTKTEQAERLKSDLAKANKKLRRSHTREKILATVAAVLAGVLILK